MGMYLDFFNVFSNVIIPGNSISIARQFLRCVLHQMAPNGIFPMLFQSNLDGKKNCIMSLLRAMKCTWIESALRISKR